MFGTADLTDSSRRIGCAFRTSRLYSFKALVVILAAVMLAGCASSGSYMGVSLVPGAASPDIQNLAQRAMVGDKQAQLDLGIAYEEGKGLSANIKRAIRLYRLAAGKSGGLLWIYSPSPGGGAPARVISVHQGAAQVGLEEAKRRLQSIQKPDS